MPPGVASERSRDPRRKEPGRRWGGRKSGGGERRKRGREEGKVEDEEERKESIEELPIRVMSVFCAPDRHTNQNLVLTCSF